LISAFSDPRLGDW